MNDILPSKRPQQTSGVPQPPSRPPQRQSQRPVRPVSPRSQSVVTPKPALMTPTIPPSTPNTPKKSNLPKQPQPLLEMETPPPLLPEKTKRSKKKVFGWIIGLFLLLILLVAGGTWGWYTLSLRPVAVGNTSRVRVKIVEGSSPSQIAELLEQNKLIRSHLAFDIYTRLSHTRSSLQAGVYSLSPSESTGAIVDHLVAGKVDQFNITFLPGATLAEDRQALLKAGYGKDEVDAALHKTYTSPIFADKPANADLEGYIFGETYNFDSSAAVEDILTKTFEEFNNVIQQNNLVEGFKKQGLTLYQGITLASIIQREVPNATDQKQVAQIFLKRLGINMALGSDVTYQYAAKKLGVAPSPDLDSPYNTRKYQGLPPGPIAVPGVTALQAVANPAPGEYLFFLSGDDDVTYYASTDEEHEANIRDHCKIKCATN